MKTKHALAAAVVVALAGCSSFPWPGAEKGAPKADEHAGHHPAGATEQQVEAAKVDKQMEAMQDMHQKMMAAKTPAERAALMKDHMKAMRDGMAMMGRMRDMPMQDGGKSSRPGGPSMHEDMMQRRMDMMEMMMLMMMDREVARPPAAR